jgi:hypothetical protein
MCLEAKGVQGLKSKAGDTMYVAPSQEEKAQCSMVVHMGCDSFENGI